MANIETKTVGPGKNKIVVNKCDYDAKFPLNKELKDKFFNKKKAK